VTKKAEQDKERSEAINALRKALKPGAEICFVVTHVARSGMQRSIEFYIPCMSKYWDTNKHKTLGGYRRRMSIERITWEMSRVLGYRIDQKHGGLIVGGCGMDMGFHCVYNLGRYLWPKGTKASHSTRNGQPDSDGGYALKSRQI
jgi:hypothetical protein